MFPLHRVNDPVFVRKNDGGVGCPASGVITLSKREVVNVFPTLHAVGIQTAGWIGACAYEIDAVELKGGPARRQSQLAKRWIIQYYRLWT